MEPLSEILQTEEVCIFWNLFCERRGEKSLRDRVSGFGDRIAWVKVVIFISIDTHYATAKKLAANACYLYLKTWGNSRKLYKQICPCDKSRVDSVTELLESKWSYSFL